MYANATVTLGTTRREVELLEGRWFLSADSQHDSFAFGAQDDSGQPAVEVTMNPGARVFVDTHDLTARGYVTHSRNPADATMTIMEATVTLHARRPEPEPAQETTEPSGYVATWQPQQWIRDYATDSGPAQTWEVSADFADLARQLVDEHDGYDRDDALRHDPAAPAALAEHDGPFTITVDHA